MIPYLVVDASVALKWALDDEEHVSQALALRDGWLQEDRYRLVAPSLFYYEILNGLRSAVLQKRISQRTGDAMLDLIFRIGVRLVDPECHHIYRLACGWNLAAYDAAYLALAETLDCPVWTGDRHFYRLMRLRSSRVCWIGDFSASAQS